MPAASTGRPRVTVFTAALGEGSLDDPLRSLLAQSTQAWEWVVVLDRLSRRPFVDDPRVRLIIDDAGDRLAPAKALACSVALGDTLVELEAGDVLASGALVTILEVLDHKPDVGFVYSDHAGILADGSPDGRRLDPLDGWTYREVDVDGRAVAAAESMQPSPHNVSYPAYAPGHVRAFRRSDYEAAGGYDPSLAAFCEHDLTCRLYQQTGFHHIESGLYLEHAPPAAGAGPGAPARYERSIQPNALAWGRRQGLTALDLVPPGRGPAAGYVGVSAAPGEGVGLVGDVAAGLDLPESSVAVIRAVDYLDRVDDHDAVWNELYRLLAHGGMVLTLTPVPTPSNVGRKASRGALADLEHGFWRLTDRAGRDPLAAVHHRFQLSWLSAYTVGGTEGLPAPYLCANLIAVKDGPRQGGLLRV